MSESDKIHYNQLLTELTKRKKLDRRIRKTEEQLAILQSERYALQSDSAVLSTKIDELCSELEKGDSEAAHFKTQTQETRAILILLNDLDKRLVTIFSNESTTCPLAGEGWYPLDVLLKRAEINSKNEPKLRLSWKRNGLIEIESRDELEKRTMMKIETDSSYLVRLASGQKIGRVLQHLLTLYLKDNNHWPYEQYLNSDYQKRNRSHEQRRKTEYWNLALEDQNRKRREKQDLGKSLYSLTEHTRSIEQHPLIDLFWLVYLEHPERIREAIIAFRTWFTNHKNPKEADARERLATHLFGVLATLALNYSVKESEFARILEIQAHAYEAKGQEGLLKRDEIELPWTEPSRRKRPNP